MPVVPPDDKRSDAAQEGRPVSPRKVPAPPLERSRFGGTERRHEPQDEDAPVSRSDLSKGPQELLEHRTARINWGVLVISSAVILAFSLWAIFLPNDARLKMKASVDWIASSLGWYYV